MKGEEVVVGSKTPAEISVYAENLTFSYSQVPVLENVSFAIEEGEFIAVLGPNGAGKSTLLKLIVGFLRPDSGRISVFGMDPLLHRKKVLNILGYLPQRETMALDMPLTVYQVVAMPLKSLGVGVDEKKIDELLKLVGMYEEKNKTFNELSGGQQQRVLLARTLVNSPKLILLDEPFNGVDVLSQEKIVELLSELTKKGVTVLAVVHNVNPLLHDVSRIMLLNRKLIAFGRADEVFTDENIIEAYGARIPLVVCEEGFTHPLYGDHHG